MRRAFAIPLSTPYVALALMLALTVFFAFHARRIRVDLSIEHLLPADDPDRVYYEDIRKTFGSEEVVVIGVFAEDVFAPATLAKIGALSDRLADLDGVREVLSLTTVKGIEVGEAGLEVGRLMRRLPDTPDAAAAFRARVLATPLYLANVVSADGHAAGITVVLESMSGEGFLPPDTEDAMRALVAEFAGPERLVLTGIPIFKRHGARLLARDLKTLAPLALLCVAGVLAGAFRAAGGVVIPLLTSLTGLVWSAGSMALRGVPLNAATLVLLPFLLAIGVAYAVRVVDQYQREARPGRPPVEVVTRAMERVALPVVLGAITTLLGFLPFALSPIQSVAEFGTQSLVGVAAVLLASLVVAPAILVRLPVPARGPAESWLGRLPERIGGAAVGRPRWTLLLVTAVAVALGWGVRHLELETDYARFFAPGSTLRGEHALVEERLAGTQPVYVVVEGGEPESVTRLETLAAVRELQDFVAAQPGVDSTLSLLDYLYEERRALQPDAAGRVPQTQSEVDQLLLLLNARDVRPVVNRDYSRATIVARTRWSDSAQVPRFLQAIEAFAATRFPRGSAVRVSGAMVLLGRAADALAWGCMTSVWQAMLVLLAVTSVAWCSLRLGLSSLLSVLLPIVAFYGIMGWTGMPLDLASGMVAAIAIGIAIDETVHLVTAYATYARRHGDHARAIAEGAGLVGRAATVTSVALATGALVVALARFQPVRAFGGLLALALALSLVATLLLTPALLAVAHGRSTR